MYKSYTQPDYNESKLLFAPFTLIYIYLVITIKRYVERTTKPFPVCTISAFSYHHTFESEVLL